MEINGPSFHAENGTEYQHQLLRDSEAAFPKLQEPTNRLPDPKAVEKPKPEELLPSFLA